MILEKSSEDFQKSILEVLGISSLGDKPKVDKPREQVAQQVDLDVLGDAGVEDTTTVEVVAIQKEIDAGEGTQNPSVVTIELKEEAEKAMETKKGAEQIESNVEQIPVARDTMKSKKGKHTISDTDFTQGPINLDSLSPV